MTMSRTISRALAVTLLAVSALFAPSTADAKVIKDFDQMSIDDQSRYVVMLLDRSVGYLKAQRQDAMARKIIDNFNARGSAGMQAFLENLDTARGLARETGKPYEVEHAMLLTLRRMGVDVPKDVMMTLASDFKESGPRVAPQRR